MFRYFGECLANHVKNSVFGYKIPESEGYPIFLVFNDSEILYLNRPEPDCTQTKSRIRSAYMNAQPYFRYFNLMNNLLYQKGITSDAQKN